MSTYPAIEHYRKCIKEAVRPSEQNLRFCFENLLKEYAEVEKLKLDREKSLPSRKRPDGTIVYKTWNIGYWESKGADIDLDEAVEKKLRDYSECTSNLLFENGKTIILYQDGRKVEYTSVSREDAAIDKCLLRFVQYRPKPIQRAIEGFEKFKRDLPDLLKSLQSTIREKEKLKSHFTELKKEFRKLCQDINLDISLRDVDEMLIQHILTADIFEAVFRDSYFHRDNHLARHMNDLQKGLFGDQRRIDFLPKYIKDSYEDLLAASIHLNEKEKQTFIKEIYEHYYKVHNPKGADTGGIVYTPTEIVQFMVRNADMLLKKHFKLDISDEKVNILDPATGTGTFICELIEYMDKDSLPTKYKNHVFANELSLLAYYIAALNIEHAYKQKIGKYKEFEGLCFADTLDLSITYGGKQQYIKEGVTDENARRVNKQHGKTIRLIIGNPPYNANQRNENENNKNREYPKIDKRIKDTFVKESTAQKTKTYDMYARFYRWAMDRLSYENKDNKKKIKQEGMIAFITNRSFVDARSFDGFRRVVQENFDYAYIVDLGGDIRAKGLGAGGNVFGIMAGVAIMFLIKEKKDSTRNCRIRYFTYPNEDDAATKLRKLQADTWSELAHKPITPDKDANWLNPSTTDFDTLLPVCDKATKLPKYVHEKALFKLYSLGVVTNRDRWVYDFDKRNLAKKVNFFINFYNKEILRLSNKMKSIIGGKITPDKMKEAVTEAKEAVNYEIQWTRDLIKALVKGKTYAFERTHLTSTMYRPFTKKYLYFKQEVNEMQYQMPSIFGKSGQKENTCICFLISKRIPFCVIATDAVTSLAMFVEPVQCLPLYRYNKDGGRLNNITDWGLKQFRAHYGDESTTREQIFAYTYAVLHAPAYREKYAIDLKRHFPRLPFYAAFARLAALGQALLDLHTGYEKASPYGLRRVDEEIKLPQPRLRRSRKAPNHIEIDEATTLTGVPSEAWDYKLGLRSALEWVLNQYKEKKDELPPIEGLQPYRLSDYKEEVIALLDKVCTVSCETVKLVSEIDELTRSETEDGIT